MSHIDDLGGNLAGRCCPHGQVLVGEHHQVQLFGVGNIGRPRGEVHRLGRAVAGELAPDAPVQFLGDVGIGDVAQLAGDDAIGVGLHLEPPSGAVVGQVPCDKAGCFQRSVDSFRSLARRERPRIQVRTRGAWLCAAGHAVAERCPAGARGKPFGRPSLVVNRRGVAGARRKISHCRAVEGLASDRCRDGRSHGQVVEREIAEVDDGSGGIGAPQGSDRFGEHLERAPSTLKPRHRADPLVEAVDQRRVERVRAAQTLGVAGRVVGSRAAHRHALVGQRRIQIPVGLRGCARGVLVDLREQSPAQDEPDLVVLGRAAHRAFRALHHVVSLREQLLNLGLAQRFRDLGGLGLERLSTGGERDDDARPRGRSRRFEQHLEPGDGLRSQIARLLVPRCGQQPQMLSDLVDHDHRRAVADDVQPHLLADGGASLVALADGGPCVGAELAGDLAPHRERGRVVGSEPVDRVEAVTHHRSHSTLAGQQRRVYELVQVRGASTARQVPQGDEAVRLATTEAGLIAVHRMLSAGRRTGIA